MTTPDLHRLSAAEREVLGLLAQGHTAKSIAAATGRSEGAVNERLREARRKAGVGSSRELARLLAQESRDEFPGVATPAEPAPAPPGAPHGARLAGKAPVMFVSFIILAALASHLAAPQERPAPTGSMPPQAAAGEAEMLEAFAAEVRDPVWASAAEAALRRRYAAIGGIDAGALSVTGRATLCEVKGRSAAGAGAARVKAGAEELASPALRGSVTGLHADVDHTSSDGAGETFRYEFAAVWRRMAG